MVYEVDYLFLEEYNFHLEVDGDINQDAYAGDPEQGVDEGNPKQVVGEEDPEQGAASERQST